MSDDDQRVRIARHFLLSSPPGEFNEVLNDVRVLIGDDDLINENLLNIIKTYNTEQMMAVPIPEANYKVVIARAGEVDPTHYVDPRGKQLLTFDHAKREVVDTRPLGDDEIVMDAEPYRAATDNHILEYVNEAFNDSGSTVFGSEADGNLLLYIYISGARTNLPNYWSGRWRSSWTFTFKRGAHTGTLKGSIRVNTHYYEGGNIQMNASTNKETEVVMGDPDTVGQHIAAVIANWETEYQQVMERSYQSMSDNALKSLRRKLPVTGVKFSFTSKDHQLAAELQKP